MRFFNVFSPLILTCWICHICQKSAKRRVACRETTKRS